MILLLPLAITIPRKRKADIIYRLNLNTYKTTHYHTLDDAKKAYKGYIQAAFNDTQVTGLNLSPPYRFTYTIFPKTRREIDVANVASIVDKFTADALVEIGVLPGDNSRIIPEIIYRIGIVDKENPRAELLIESLTKK